MRHVPCAIIRLKIGTVVVPAFWCVEWCQQAAKPSLLGTLTLTLARTGGLVHWCNPLRFFADSEKNNGATCGRVLVYLMGQTLRNF